MNKKGQALVEYVLIIALISVVVIGIVNAFGGYLKDAMTKSSCSLVDQEYVKGEKVGEGYCKDKNDWFHQLFLFLNILKKFKHNSKGGKYGL